MFPKIKTAYKPTQKNIGDQKMDKEKSSGMKPDKTCHEKKHDMGTMAKKTTLPGQMYVPKKVHNESEFAGEER